MQFLDIVNKAGMFICICPDCFPLSLVNKLRIEMLRSYNKYMFDFEKTTKETFNEMKKKETKIYYPTKSTKSQEVRQSMTFEPGPTPSLSSLSSQQR